MGKLLRILLLATVSGFGQSQTDTITIRATRLVSLQPDQLVFQLQVTAAQNAGLDDVLAEVGGVGVTAADLTGVSSYPDGKLTWEFIMAVPISQASATTTQLLELEQNGESVAFFVQGTQVSQQLQKSQGCSQAGLISDAQAQAQSLAAAAGFSVGPVLSVSDGGGEPSPAAVVRLGSIPNVLTSTFINVESFVVPTPPVNCTAVVKFQLYRYH